MLDDFREKDADVRALRDLHEKLDRAVLDAYGWRDLPVAPYCMADDSPLPDQEAFEDAIAQRLFKLNAVRASDGEVRLRPGVRRAKPEVRLEPTMVSQKCTLPTVSLYM